MPAGTDGDSQLTQVVLKGLGDKLYDKRKAAALEVEQLIKNLSKEVDYSHPYCAKVYCGSGGALSFGILIDLVISAFHCGCASQEMLCSADTSSAENDASFGAMC